MSKKYDIVVIGGGPGGYAAAIRAAQLGFTVACCESNAYDDPKGKPRLGGTCLNAGCIPLKSLLVSSSLFIDARERFASHGIIIDAPTLDVRQMLARKDAIVNRLAQGIAGLFKKNKVTFLPVHGAFAGTGQNRWQIRAGDQIVEADKVIVATGSRARHLPGIPIDNTIVCDNVGALKFNAVPKQLLIVGAGVVGLEMAHLWRRLGSQVTLLDIAPEFLPQADADISREAARLFAGMGIDIRLGVTLGDVRVSKKGVALKHTGRSGITETLAADRLIVAAGRAPNTDGLNAEAVGLRLDEQGRVKTDEKCQTNLPGVFAVGDVTDGPMLAHKAMEEAILVAEHLAGQAGSRRFETIPWVLYTSPEIAWVGQTEQQLKAKGVAYRSGKAPFMASGRALSADETAGFVKILADAATDRVLGVHILGGKASELIAEAVLAMEFSAASEDIARICHAHPTLSETLREAALACDRRALHC